MRKRYDTLALNCKGCGWLRCGSYQDGMPYLACGWWGYIMDGQSDEICTDARTVGQVANYIKASENKTKKKKI